MDWARRPYTTLARFHRSPDAPLVKIRWYFTDLPFQEFPSVINSLDWDEEPWRPRLLGEVWRAPRTYNGVTHIAGLTGVHQCGEQVWFAEGIPWPYTGPPMVYDIDQIPFCCGRVLPPDWTDGGAELGGEVPDQFFAVDQLQGGAQLGGEVADQFFAADQLQGGAQLGGEVGDAYGFPDQLQGGAQLGGEVGDVLGFADQLQGGAQLGGEVADQFFAADQLQGGAQLGGEVGDAYGFPDQLQGGAQLGGEVGDVLGFADQLQGGAQLGGEVGDAYGFPDQLQGGGQLGGEVLDFAVIVDQLAGGGQLGGEVAEQLQFTDALEGGGQLGGEVGDVFTPGGNPGNTCATAIPMPVNTGTGMVCDPTKELWTTINAGGFTPYTVHFFSGGATATTAYIYIGTCAALTLVSGPHFGNANVPLPFVPPTTYLLRIVNSGGVTDILSTTWTSP